MPKNRFFLPLIVVLYYLGFSLVQKAFFLNVIVCWGDFFSWNWFHEKFPLYLFCNKNTTGASAIFWVPPHINNRTNYCRTLPHYLSSHFKNFFWHFIFFLQKWFCCQKQYKSAPEPNTWILKIKTKNYIEIPIHNVL